MADLVLLGPQRHHPQLQEAAKSNGLAPPWAVISAGWQEREAEIEELEAHLGGHTRNLSLYQRAEDVFSQDSLLREALHQHQQQLISLQEIYRIRLRHTMGAVQNLLKRKKPGKELLDPEIEDSFRAIKRLDDHHLGRIKALNQAFNEQWRLDRHDLVQEHRHEIAQILDRSSCALIAGGHVAILLNRMRLFGLPEMLENKPCIAWSAGAMVLGEKIVLFHDSPPQGRGYAEVLEWGLAKYSNRLVFPSASKRLALGDPIRIAMLVRRFPDAQCWTLDERAMLTRQNGQWTENEFAQCLSFEDEVWREANP